jgi:hypothetical protein
LYFIGLNTGLLNPRKRKSFFGWCATRRIRLIVTVLFCLTAGAAKAQTRGTASHGKTRLDSFNYLLRDVHPASQAMANYLQNLLFLQGLKKARRLEHHERVDTYEERGAIEDHKKYMTTVYRLMAGRPTSPQDMDVFWGLVSVYGDREEVNYMLGAEVPPMTHRDFVMKESFFKVVQASGELVRPPLVLEGMQGVDATAFQTAWNAIAKSMRSGKRPLSRDVAEFRTSVGAYCQSGRAEIEILGYASGKGDANRYLGALKSLSNALNREKQCAQIQKCVAEGGYAFHGGSMIGLCQHMLKNRVTPAHGSTAQVTLAELARPISRAIEQEMSLNWERIDSLAAGEGHRPYAAEYRGGDESFSAMPNAGAAPAEPAPNVGN